MLATSDIFLFEGFHLDRRDGGLFRQDERGVFVPVAIGGRALDVLGVLIERPGVLVSKDEIMKAVWARTAVENANLTIQISALRRVLDQARPDGSCIQTVAAQGYRFVAPVTRVEQPAGSNAVAPADILAVNSSSATAGRRRIVLAGLAATIAALLAPLIAWFVRPAPITSPALLAADAPISSSASVPRLSIVVLPFANLSDDPGQQYIADGITDDLTTDLSRLPNMLVIARNTAFTYKGKSVDAKQIGRELGVRYLLEGSVQRSANQLRVNTQLIDGEAGSHLWAERFDRAVGDLFALQNDITSRIAATLDLELVAAEAARLTDKPDALEYVLRGRAVMTRGPPTRESYADAIGFFEKALALDPNSIDPQRWLALALTSRMLDGLSAAPAEDFRRAEAVLASALGAAPRDPLLHYVKGQILRAVAQGLAPPFRLSAEARVAGFADAIPEYETMLAANPNDVRGLANLAWCKFMTGAEEEAIPLFEKVIRLSPREPSLYLQYFRLGIVHFFRGRLDEAILWLEKARRANPRFAVAHSLLAAALGVKGDAVRAAAELAEYYEAAKGHADSRFATIALVRKNGDLNTPALHDRFEEFLIAGLRKAGLPEE
ncbi:MAG TPA: winged helix-turn-helix domain-containing tetratricopeptide repeat protein [Stellaceae bacterium]